jgi:two-component system CitB family sensor kinase
VEVSLLAEADILHMVVVDSGDGVPPDAVDRLFDQDFTTAADDARPHGVGLSLARRLTRRHCGDLSLTRPSGADCGAVFVARLPGAFDSRSSRPEPEAPRESVMTTAPAGETP